MKTQRQISFKVPPGLWGSFREQTDSLFLNCAPFLDHMISNEIPELRADLAGRKLSLRAKRHIAGELKRQEPKSRNIEVRPETADAITEVVKEHNLVRDAFICRLLMFLRSSDSLLNYLDVPRRVGSRFVSAGLEDMPSSPMKALEAVRNDPLFYVRHHVRENWECGIYTVPLPRSLDWAACWLEDEQIPGTKAYRDNKKLLASMFEMDEIEAFADKTSSISGGKK